MKEQRIYNINQYKTYRCGVTGQPVTAAIVVARFHRPPFLIRAVSILFTFAEKVCALSWFTQERKEFYFYMTHFCRDERTQITQITKSLAFFGVWRRKEISPHSFSCCRSHARRLETQTHTQTHTFDDREILQRWRRRRERRNRRWVVVQVVVVRRNRNTP